MKRLSVEMRAASSSRTIKGHAAVFDQETRVGSYWERIERGAFKEAIDRGDDVRALFNHDEDKLLGRRSSGTLRMRETDHGLEVEIDLPDTTLGNDVLELVRRGDITGMSFGFIPGDEEWETRDGEQIRVHRSIAKLVDVSPVTFPAYEGTDVQIRKRKVEVMAEEERAMSVEELVAALEDIIARAKDEETGEERPLTEEEQARYAELERQLELARRSEEIRARHVENSKIARPIVARTQVNERDREFRNYLLNPESRGQVIGTPSAGGYTVPESWANELIRQIETYGGLASAVRTVNTSTGEPLHYTVRTLDQNKAEIVDEATAPVSGADLVFDQVTLGAFSYQSSGADGDPFRVSRELLQDSMFDIAGELASVAAERISRALADDLVSGNGTTAPQGITTSTGPSATFAGAAPTYEELVDAVHKIDPAYRRGSVWVFNDSTLAAIRKLTDENGRPLLENATQGIADGMSATLLGFPVVVDQAFDNFADASGNAWGVFGNLREGYILRRVMNVEVLADPYTAISTREVLYTAWARFDGKIRNPLAFALLKNDAA